MIYWWYIFRRRSKPQAFKPVVLITGCSSGLGLAAAKLFYNLPEYRVIATARKKSIDALKSKFKENDRFIVRELDVTDETNRHQLISDVCGLWDGINVLVNNAGISYRSVIEHMTETDEQKQMATNYLGPIGLIRDVLPHMRSLGRGKIINVSSVSGMLAMPTMASYSASKYALEGASEALWYEMKPLGISVSLIQPGFIKSDSFKNVFTTVKAMDATQAKSAYWDYYASMEPFVSRLMNMSLTTPEQIADLVLKVVRTQNPPLWIPATLDAWFFYYLRRFLPRTILLQVLFLMLPGSRQWAKDYSKRRA